MRTTQQSATNDTVAACDNRVGRAHYAHIAELMQDWQTALRAQVRASGIVPGPGDTPVVGEHDEGAYERATYEAKLLDKLVAKELRLW